MPPPPATPLPPIIYTRPRPPQRIQIVPSDPTWRTVAFPSVAARLRAALGPSSIIAIHHVGSTSVPGLAAKPIIDVNLIIEDSTDEASYIPLLEAAGFMFVSRDPAWSERRYLVLVEDPPGDERARSANGEAEYGVSVGVYGRADTAHVEDHLRLREWLSDVEGHKGDREAYVAAKRAAAEAVARGEAEGEEGSLTDRYHARKRGVIEEILERVYKSGE
ncbi:GrpB domain protein [Podospora appendiculata]|uniref:GrpB domain protein n=1 Tax=Podospora appendiculata TaxID=314037 RepID=A0AAE0XFC6_9PEZI|nr:GrpB domain protein [Podospora appendiculata]